MDAATFATGVSLDAPAARSSTSSYLPFARAPPASIEPTLASLASETRPGDANNAVDLSSSYVDTEQYQAYGAMQELAYHWACESAEAGVDAVVTSANVSCYREVLSFFERFRSLPTPTPPEPLVSFPEFHAFPAAGVISGADATSSDMWIGPLCQVLQRSFPLVLVLPPDVTTARRLIEWIAEQLDAVKSEREHQEKWLEDQINGFDLHSEKPAQVTPQKMPVAKRETRSKRQRMMRHLEKRRVADLHDAEAFYRSDSSFDGGSGSSSDDVVGDEGGSRRARPIKRGRGSTKKKGASGSRPFAKWTIDQLLKRIGADLNGLVTGSDSFETWITTMREMVLSSLKEMIHIGASFDSEDSSCDQTISLIRKVVQGCQASVEWLIARISAFKTDQFGRYHFQSTGSSGSVLSSSVKIKSAEFALAQLLHEVLQISLEYSSTALSSAGLLATSKSLPTMESDQSIRVQHDTTQLRADLRTWQTELRRTIEKYEMQYQLHHYRAPSKDIEPKPYLLVCVEQLETFSSQVLDDFLEIWTHFRQTQLNIMLETSCGRTPALAGFMSLGLIVGAASAASPALRRLPLAVVSRLDMQFFQLDDSLKCFDDILEGLVVEQQLPLTLSGSALRLLAERHRTTQSIGVFLHALRFLLYTHFKQVPWSALILFMEATNETPPPDEQTGLSRQSRALSSWLRHNDLPWREYQIVGEAMSRYLDYFPRNGAYARELQGIVKRSTKKRSKLGDDAEWKESVAEGLAAITSTRARWIAGWKCFRCACSFLDVPLKGDIFLRHLILALDGKLLNGILIHQVAQNLEQASADELSVMISEWRKIVCSEGLQETRVVDVLDELIMLCEYAMETLELPETKPMMVHVRNEIRDVLIDHFIVEFLQAPVDGGLKKRTKPTLTDLFTIRLGESVIDNLHFSYHDKLKDVLVDKATGADSDGERAPSWLDDVSLAFLYYQENPGMHLSLRDWFDAFADALLDAEGEQGRRSKKDRQTEAKARFLRAFCTLRHWGFVKSDMSSDRDSVEKLVFI